MGKILICVGNILKAKADYHAIRFRMPYCFVGSNVIPARSANIIQSLSVFNSGSFLPDAKVPGQGFVEKVF